MKLYQYVILISLLLTPIGCSSEPVPTIDVSEVQMLFWESQSWKGGGGSKRLTIWADGRSEILVFVNSYEDSEKFRPRKGWEMKEDGGSITFLRSDVMPEKVAKDKFNQALAAGIHQLKTFEANYSDGGGTLVGIQVEDELKTTTIPMFLEQHKGTKNRQRFIATGKILGQFLDKFDTQAYDIQN